MLKFFKHVSNQGLGAVLLSCFILFIAFIYFPGQTQQERPKLPLEIAPVSPAPLALVFDQETAIEEVIQTPAKKYAPAPEDQPTVDVESLKPHASSIVNTALQDLASNYSKGSAYIDTRSMCKSPTYASIESTRAYCKGIDFSSYDADFVSRLEKGLQNKNITAGETLIEYWNSELMLQRQGAAFMPAGQTAETLEIQNKLSELYFKLSSIDSQRASDLKNRLGLNFK